MYFVSCLLLHVMWTVCLLFLSVFFILISLPASLHVESMLDVCALHVMGVRGMCACACGLCVCFRVPGTVSEHFGDVWECIWLFVGT